MLPQKFLRVDSCKPPRLKDCAVNKFVLESNKYHLNLEIDTFVEGYEQ